MGTSTLRIVARHSERNMIKIALRLFHHFRAFVPKKAMEALRCKDCEELGISFIATSAGLQNHYGLR